MSLEAYYNQGTDMLNMLGDLEAEKEEKKNGS